MLRLTFDHNCIIDLDEDRQPHAQHLRELLTLHDAGRIVVRLTAVSASEKPLGGPYHTNFKQFQDRLRMLGLERLEPLKPICYRGIAFRDWCVLGGGELSTLDEHVHRVLFPALPLTLSEYVETSGDGDTTKLEANWRNRKCDVLSMWCHLYYGGDVFVTRDKNSFSSRRNCFG